MIRFIFYRQLFVLFRRKFQRIDGAVALNPLIFTGKTPLKAELIRLPVVSKQRNSIQRKSRCLCTHPTIATQFSRNLFKERIGFGFIVYKEVSFHGQRPIAGFGTIIIPPVCFGIRYRLNSTLDKPFSGFLFIHHCIRSCQP